MSSGRILHLNNQIFIGYSALFLRSTTQHPNCPLSADNSLKPFPHRWRSGGVVQQANRLMRRLEPLWPPHHQLGPEIAQFIWALHHQNPYQVRGND